MSLRQATWLYASWACCSAIWALTRVALSCVILAGQQVLVSGLGRGQVGLGGLHVSLQRRRDQVIQLRLVLLDRQLRLSDSFLEDGRIQAGQRVARLDGVAHLNRHAVNRARHLEHDRLLNGQIDVAGGTDLGHLGGRPYGDGRHRGRLLGAARRRAKRHAAAEEEPHSNEDNDD